MEKEKIEVTKKLALKDGTELKIKEFNAEEGEVSVTILGSGYQEVIEALTAEQIADIQILNELGEVVLTAKGYSLGNRISVNTQEDTTLEVKETREAVVDATKAIQALQNTSEQNTADITAINEAIASLAEIVGGE